MKVEKGEYILIQPTSSKKSILAKVTKLSKDGKHSGVIIDKSMADPQGKAYFTFTESDVQVNLGLTPKLGSVYGVNVEIYNSSVQSELFGTIYFFRKIDDETKTRIINRLELIGSKLDKRGLFPNKNFEVYIREPKGQWAGYWKYHKNEDKFDEMCLRDPEFSPKELSWLIYHELGHGIWFHNMTADWRAKWIAKYNSAVKLSKVSGERLDELRKALLSCATVAEFNRQLDVDDKAIFKEILRNIKHSMSVDNYDINDLIHSGDDLSSIWPKTCDISKKNLLVSEYGASNVKELWSEAFSYYMTKREVPKDIEKLVNKTLDAITSGASDSE